MARFKCLVYKADGITSRLLNPPRCLAHKTSVFSFSSLGMYALLLSFFLTSYFLLPTSRLLFAQGYIYWPENGIRVNPWGMASMVSDGKGGAIIFTGRDDSIFVQRINSDGELLWNGTHGYYVYGGESGELYGGAIACSDGRGGAIVAFGIWSWVTFDDIYAQRVDSLGNIMWGIGGVPVCTADSAEREYTVISDGAGGGIFAWQDTRHLSIGEGDIYAQRVDSAGNLMWTINGVPVCTTTWHQETPAICSDGKKGAVITWYEPIIVDVFAQRVDSSGTPEWGTNGKVICATPNFEGAPTLSLVDTNSIIIAWMDNRNGNYDIYAQRVNLNGDTLWPGGVAICTAESLQGGLQVIADGSDGAIILWYDERLNGLYDFYIQRVDGSGIIMWTANGVPVCIDDSIQQYPVMISDGAGGAIIAWVDKRNYGASPQNWDIYAQHIDSSGIARWQINGMPICTAPGSQGYYKRLIVPDSAGGAIIGWSAGYGAVGGGYVQRVNDLPPPPLPEISLSDTFYNFGNVIVGDSAFWEYLVIKNLGHGDLLIDSVISTNSAFSILETFPDTISFWDSLNISVKFIPQDTGYIFGFLKIYSNDPDEESLSVRLVGNGVLGIAEVRSQRQEARLKIYPNPFFGKTTIRYRIHDTGFSIEDIKSQKMKDESQKISLKIYDVSGRLVKTLVNEPKVPGIHTVRWDATDNNGRNVSSGVYFIKLNAGDFGETRKTVLLR